MYNSTASASDFSVSASKRAKSLWMTSSMPSTDVLPASLAEPNDDDSPVAGEEAPGSGIGDNVNHEADRAASEAERDAVEEAAENPMAPDDVVAADAEEKERESS